MDSGFNQNSRSGYRAKRRKTNLILNSLIVVVILLILFVAYNIFASGNDDTSSEQKTAPKTEQSVHKEKQDQSTTEENTEAQNTSSQDTTTEGTNAGEETPADQTDSQEKADDTQAVVSAGGSSSNVLKTIENPAWKPVGTSQTGTHNPSYDSSSTDWQEMLNAISYATGLEQSNMTVYWLGRDRSTANASIGTVYSKDKQQKYRVYLKWVDGEGWTPTKVEELAELEK